jgi:hypothetical protein
MKLAGFALLLFAACLPGPEAFAHGGGLDASGGHFDRSTGSYHYHGGGGGGFSGFGGFGSVYSVPSPRVRARTTVRTKPRTEAKSTSRQPSLRYSSSFDAAPPSSRSSASTQDDRPTRASSVDRSASGAAFEDPEQKARELLRLAKLLLDQGKIPGTLSYLRKLVDAYPETQAGKEGDTLLKKLEQDAKQR